MQSWGWEGSAMGLFPFHPEETRGSSAGCGFGRGITANLTYLTVPSAELEGISRIGRIPATQIDPTWFETINPLISRVRISWPTTLMYFSLVLTAGERSPLALRGLFPSLFLFFLEEKLIMDTRSLAQMKHGESRAVGLQFIWFSLSVQPPASLIRCCFMEKYSSASQLLHWLLIS